MKRTLIIGGGASGLLVAIHLTKRANAKTVVHIADPCEQLGQGLAYSTDDQGHLLNVPAGRMSAFPDDSNHFVHWSGKDGNYFAPRKDYGIYLIQTFMEIQVASSNASFEHLRQEVESLDCNNEVWAAHFKDGSVETYDSVVLALGHGKPIEIPTLNSLKNEDGFIADPWRTNKIPKVGTLAAIGTGLTFIDLALSHLRRNSKNTVVGISRNGLLPKDHLAQRAAALPVPDSAKSSPAEMRTFIENSSDWRAAQDGVRHQLPEIWHGWSESMKREFFTEHLRWWNVHRHRVSPEIQEEITSVIQEGRLKIIAGELESIESNKDGFLLNMKSGEKVSANSIVNCLGYTALGNGTLIGKLIEKGIAKAGPLELGIRTDFPKFNVIDDSGKAHENLFAIGPVLLGERFETTAIPELREQAAEIAFELTKL